MRSNPLTPEIISLIILSLILLSSPFLEVLMITRYFILFASYLFCESQTNIFIEMD